MHLTFWQPIPSPHQRGLLEALASAPWVKSVRLRYEAPLSDERRAQGWEDAEFIGVDVAPILPGEQPKTGPDQVNVFTGFHTHPGVWAVFKRIPAGAAGLCLVYAEAPELRSLAGLGRSLKYRLAAQRLKGRVHGVLALGDLGADFYRKLFGTNVPVTPFAYYDRSERDRVGEPETDAKDLQLEAGGLKSESGGSKTESGSQKTKEGSRTADDESRTSNVVDEKPEHKGRNAEDGVRVPESSAQNLTPEIELPAPIVSPGNLNLIINGLSFQAGALSLPPAGSTSPGFDPQVSFPSSSPRASSASNARATGRQQRTSDSRSPVSGFKYVPPPALRGESLRHPPSLRNSAQSGLKSQASPGPSGLSSPVFSASTPQVSSNPPIPPRHVAPMLGKIGAVHSNTRRLLFVGQCIWRKGLDQLLEALASMPPSTPPWVLDVVGTGSEEGVFMHMAEKLDLVDRVRFCGMVKGNALEQFYLRADLVIAPSRWDGWGMAVNEALFAGVPVAATDCCGAASVIKDLPRCMVLPAKRTEEWPEYLSEWLEWGGAMKSDRVRLQKAAESLTGEAGVELLRKTIEQARKHR